MPKYYAVRVGRTPGIYTHVEDFIIQTNGYGGTIGAYLAPQTPKRNPCQGFKPNASTPLMRLGVTWTSKIMKIQPFQTHFH